jgi:hypothetical protein
MKLVFILFLSLLVICIYGCKKCDDIPKDVPACISKVIKDGVYDSTFEVTSIEEYKYQGKVVYKLNPPDYIADASSIIVTGECAKLCFVGGFVGPGAILCNGENFFEKAVLVRRVWQK